MKTTTKIVLQPNSGIIARQPAGINNPMELATRRTVVTDSRLFSKNINYILYY